MKKTIAALLVTILASAGYVMLDKAAVEKIDRLESQVSVQQEMLQNFGAADTRDMENGQTLQCYPSAGMTAVAYVYDPSVTNTTAPYSFEYSTTKHVEESSTEYSASSTAPTASATTMPQVATTYHVSDPVLAQSDERTATTVWYDESTSWTKPQPSETEPHSRETQPTYIVEPTYWYSFDELYHLRADVLIRSVRCEMTGKSLTGIPQFTITLTGQTASTYAGREVEVSFGEETDTHPYGRSVIRPDGTFTVVADVTLLSPSTVPGYDIVIH